MEIFNVYKAVVNALFLVNQRVEISTAFIIGIILGVLLWGALFVLQGIGLCAMAKNSGLEKRWLAFVPFVNILYIGKLSGPSEVFGQRMKNAALFAMIAQILTFVLSATMTVIEACLYLEYGAPQYDLELGLPYWTQLSASAQKAYNFYEFGTWLLSVFQLIYEILLFIVLMSLYKKYSPRNYTMLSFLALFIPLARYITIFVLRNRTPIDYQAYVRARHEAYMRQRGFYTQQYAQQEKPQDPFTEFASAKNDSENKNSADENPFEDF